MVDMKERLWIPIALVALAALYGCRGGKETVQNAPPDEAAAEGAGSGSASSEPGMGSSEGSASSSHRGSPGGSPGRRTASGRRAPADEAAGESEIPPRGEQPRPQKTRETMTLPEGRKIRVQLDATLSSKSNGVGDTFTATVSDPLRLHGAEDGKAVTLKEGMKVEGTVTEVEPAKRVKGLAKLVLRFDALVLEDGTRVPITATLSSVAPSTKKRDAATIAGGAAAGALLGKLFGKHGKDALVGAIAGGAIGTGVVLGTKGKEVEMKEGTELSIQLQKPANIPVT